ncbi:Hsp60 family chaperonin [Methylococcus capsulatus]|uniref:Chaperonin GroEL 3 n=1 Tax=Methylococcus capsulatus (strain ATCC 33009 / NCIMB 11132 / Bath) TaxID=243233 RepID=CH603_METCA|nr:molecular chaperone GroEL [Methylococcus capsulatus]Q7WZ32.1 RecName: Full=Chaperonin GroEL 3; AltName: Full=60 kDa chaperonin 3; AltName: Full=Chaperonin-60 3; Short=Cpn60 3 [Methylococcus capsulatus str. Bath]AAP80770.1 MmoG [Methylococcus capsulatus str. Bath]AAU92713.1 chaperonin, 60 kDa subunit [Methylococcus capsulatus str. Bath]QXP88071.1 molecular chaperone GroEL [Methylococcus capsulatus]QXP90576.1 molecular chaperone GroEL [Methylococcus capsulatus]UQN13099.1 molecular chaperone 
MAKEVVYRGSARQRMMQGIEILARAAIPTLGATGPSVMIQHRADGLPPISTRDGVTVANSIVLKDRVANLGARLLRDVAGTMSREAGDGTTTAIVLARHIAREMFKSLAVGADPIALKRGIDRAVARVSEDIGARAWRGDKESVILGVAAVATKGEPGVGRLLLEALDAVGVHGAVSIELGQRREDLLDVVDGYRWEKGYLSPYFVTDRARELAELEDVYLLMTDREVVDFIDLVPLLEAVTEAGGSLLIAADRVHEKALAGLLLNHVRGVFKAVAVTAPGFGDKRPNRLLDLAALTGGRAVLEAQGDRLDRVTLADLGRVRRAVVSADDTALLGIPGTEASRARLEGLRLEAEQYRALKPGQGSATGRLHELEEIEARIVGLSGKSAVYRVGGVTDVEMKERMVRIENAYRSVVSALEEGVLPGGGVGFLGSMPVLAELEARDADEARGIGIVRSALTEPLRIIGENSGLSGEAVVAKVMDHANPGWGYDQESGSFCDLHARGIWDAAKVLRLALEKAASVAGTFLTTEAVVLEIPDTDAFAGFSAEWAAATREDPRV